MFEAGALTKSIKDGRLCTYLLGLRPSEVEPPLGQFQHTTFDKEDTRKLVHALNSVQQKPLKDTALNETFDMWWPKLEDRIKGIPAPKDEPTKKRSTDDMLEEVLNLLRGMQRPEAHNAASMAFLQGLGLRKRGERKQRSTLWDIWSPAALAMLIGQRVRVVAHDDPNLIGAEGTIELIDVDRDNDITIQLDKNVSSTGGRHITVKPWHVAQYREVE
jgi:hypothetical protein